MSEHVHYDHSNQGTPGYPFAPEEWSESEAARIAATEGLSLSSDHLEVLQALQEYFSKHDKPDINVRELHDALDERFHSRGGMKYLYILFPAGPVAQGCHLAGLPIPAGSIDLSFGSVQ